MHSFTRLSSHPSEINGFEVYRRRQSKMPLVIKVDREREIGIYSEKGSLEHSSYVSTKDISTSLKVENATSWAGTIAEKRLVRKLDMRIMPLTCIAYFFACELIV